MRRTTETRVARAAGSVPWTALDGLAVLGALVLAWAVVRMPILTPDVWWHLATGRLILADGIPQTDPFSWALAGSDWFLHEWLADVLLMRLHETAGLLGIVTLRSVLVVVAFLVAYRLARLHAGTLLSLALLAPAAWATQRNWLDRPQLWTFVFLPLAVWLLENARQGGVTRRTFVLVPLLMVAWANLHGGFMIGLAVIGLWTAAVLVQGWHAARAGASTQDRRGGRADVAVNDAENDAENDAAPAPRRWFLLLALAVLATLATPNLVDGLLYPLRYLGSGLSATVNEERVGQIDSNYARLHLLLLVSLLTLFVVRVRRVALPHLAVGLLLAAISMPRLGGFSLPFAAERHAPLFLLVGTPILVWQLYALLGQRLPSFDLGALRRPLAWGTAGVAIAVAVTLCAAQWPRDGSAAARLLPGRYPVAATEWLQRNSLPQRMVNPYRWGGWFLFHLWPQYSVSIDSRGDLYGSERIRESEFLWAIPSGGSARVQELLDRDAIDLVVWQLLTLDFGDLQLSPLADWLLQSPEWRLVFWDRPNPQTPNHPAGTTGVFLREHARNEASLKAYPAVQLPRLPGRRRHFGFAPQR